MTNKQLTPRTLVAWLSALVRDAASRDPTGMYGAAAAGHQSFWRLKMDDNDDRTRTRVVFIRRPLDEVTKFFGKSRLAHQSSTIVLPANVRFTHESGHR